jgi:hypothetical protein
LITTEPQPKLPIAAGLLPVDLSPTAWAAPFMTAHMEDRLLPTAANLYQILLHHRVSANIQKAVITGTLDVANPRLSILVICKRNMQPRILPQEQQRQILELAQRP